MTILTNHMRENETCNRPRWTQMDTSAEKATIPILVTSHQPWNTCVQTNTPSTTVVACPVLCSIEFLEVCLTPQVLPAEPPRVCSAVEH